MRLVRTSSVWLGLPVLALGALACGGGGGGGGDAFTVAGLWTIDGTTTAGAPNPDNGVCRAVADLVGDLPPTTLSVSDVDGTVTATEVGSDLAFAGTANDSAQSFTLNSTTPICQTSGSCTVCGSVGIDFFDAGGDTADVNVALGAAGNAGCPGQCTLAFATTANRS